ncbi:MAG: hypothetical protein WCI49_07420, partial [Ferruginibacter sp.]
VLRRLFFSSCNFLKDKNNIAFSNTGLKKFLNLAGVTGLETLLLFLRHTIYLRKDEKNQLN